VFTELADIFSVRLNAKHGRVMPRTSAMSMLKNSRHVSYCYGSRLNQMSKLAQRVDSFRVLQMPPLPGRSRQV
jgi:hypothetical protein